MHTPYTCDVPVYKEYVLHLWRPLPTAFGRRRGTHRSGASFGEKEYVLQDGCTEEVKHHCVHTPNNKRSVLLLTRGFLRCRWVQAVHAILLFAKGRFASVFAKGDNRDVFGAIRTPNETSMHCVYLVNKRSVLKPLGGFFRSIGTSGRFAC